MGRKSNLPAHRKPPNTVDKLDRSGSSLRGGVGFVKRFLLQVFVDSVVLWWYDVCMKLTIDDLKRCKLGAVVGNNAVKWVKVAENVAVNHGTGWHGSGENGWPWLRIGSADSGLSDDRFVASQSVTLLFGEVESAPPVAGDRISFEDAKRLPKGSAVEVRACATHKVKTVIHADNGKLRFASGVFVAGIYSNEYLQVAYVAPGT